MITKMHTNHTTAITQLNEQTSLRKGEDDSKRALKTAASEDNTSDARGVCTDRTKNHSSEASGVCTKSLIVRITSMEVCRNQRYEDELSQHDYKKLITIGPVLESIGRGLSKRCWIILFTQVAQFTEDGYSYSTNSLNIYISRNQPHCSHKQKVKHGSTKNPQNHFTNNKSYYFVIIFSWISLWI